MKLNLTRIGIYANDYWSIVPDDEEYEKGKHKGLAVEKVNDFIATLKNKKSLKEEI